MRACGIAYFAVVIRRFVLALLLLAVAAAPFSMMGGAAMAHAPAAEMTAGHCEGMKPAAPKGDVGRAIDCMMICSTVLPSALAAPAQVAMAPLSPVAAPLRTIGGVEPLLELPPPRTA